MKGFLTVLEKKWGEKKRARCYPKNRFVKANIAQFVLGLAQIPGITGGTERRVIAIVTTLLGGKR